MPGTYVGLKLTRESEDLMRNYMSQCGLEGCLPISKLHCTLYYADKAPIPEYTPDPTKMYESYVIGYGFLGKGEWAALVLNLFSPAMFKQHKKIAEYGSPHSYPEFVPHMSIKYGPMPTDIEYVKNHSPLGMTLMFTGEYAEPIKE